MIAKDRKEIRRLCLQPPIGKFLGSLWLKQDKDETMVRLSTSLVFLYAAAVHVQMAHSFAVGSFGMFRPQTSLRVSPSLRGGGAASTSMVDSLSS